MSSQYGQPLQGNGPPTAAVIATGQAYQDRAGQKLWRPTNDPNVYQEQSGAGAGLRTVATLAAGVVTVTRNGVVVQG